MRSFFIKLALIVGLVVLIGPPINDALEVIPFIALLIWTVLGVVRAPASPHLLKCIGIAAVCLVAKTLLPSIRMQEGHNVFLAEGGKHEAALRQALPEPVYAYAKAAFERIYDINAKCRVDEGCWRKSGPITVPFSFSADGALQSPRWSRVVALPSYDSLTSFRGGFLNGPELRGIPMTGWLDGLTGVYDPVRAQLPFFVVYEIPASLAGQAVCTGGTWFWQPAGVASNAAPALHHDGRDQVCRALTAADAGARLYGLAIDPRLPISMGFRSKLTGPLLSHSLRRLLGLAAAALLVFAVIAADWRRLSRFALATAPPAMLFGLVPMFKVFKEPLFAGGADQLVHWSYGIRILETAIAGEWREALRGVESVFFFMPGYRYVRAIEMLIFGDSAFLAMLVLLAAPYLLFEVARQTFDLRTALVSLPVGWMAFYLSIGKINALAEMLAYPAICAALLMAYRALPEDHQRDRLFWAFAAALTLAFSVLLRPNMGIAAVLMLAALWLCLMGSERLPVAPVLAVGFAPVGLLLLHNLVFGNRFVLATTAPDLPINMPAAPATYLAAAMALLTGRWGDEAVGKIRTQLASWITGDGGVPLVACLAMLIFAAVHFGRPCVRELVCGRLLHPRALMMLALIAGMEIPLLIFYPSGRYAYLAGFLLTITAIDLGLALAAQTGVAAPLSAERWARLRARLS